MILTVRMTLDNNLIAQGELVGSVDYRLLSIFLYSLVLDLVLPLVTRDTVRARYIIFSLRHATTTRAEPAH